MNNKILMNAYLNCVEQYFEKQCFIYENEPQQTLFEAMRYSLLAGGKRLRPVFVFDFCRMCGGDWKSAVPFAAAIEMIHTYSLIHDDLPCMDNDDYRRGKPTNHKIYGEAMAVLAGDALLTAAFAQFADAPYDAQVKINAVNMLAQCAGQTGMVGGQALDMQSESRQCTAQEVIAIQSRKTGALIKAACVLGVLAGNGNTQQIKAAEVFADNLGLAFQIRDDMLDIIGNQNELGKAIGADEHKNTFVKILGLDACAKLVAEHTDKAIDALSAFADPSFMVKLSQALTDRTA